MPEVLRTDASWIQKTPGVCGGRACIRRTRITVWGLVQWRRLGLTEIQIPDQITSLTPADLAAAWAYYEQHRQEIDQDILENEEEP